ncbi:MULTISPECIES: hypothetical protein [Mesorhizobium]|uniref:hypothetical protein n=1 Tax=Mesorhizobium TaxID=68287 RepID=UPI0003CE5518|nr:MULTISPECIES: hypothetical protein [Mesorhizobium]ESY66866.1 hypothetical protein X742_16885 [Mesorhizobium sp. LNHC232B00]WJI41754.1 hypothetical protein NL534_16515 [Mesorhizobium opportunistum]
MSEAAGFGKSQSAGFVGRCCSCRRPVRAERLSSHDDANSAQMTVNEMILDDHQQDGLQT